MIRKKLYYGIGLVMALVTGLPLISQAGTYGDNLLPAGNFEDVNSTYIPWAGVDDGGNIHGIDGSQLSVDDSGNIGAGKFAPSVAVGDLNGDGKPDLVMADAKGYFWYFPNSGTASKPVFKQGEIMPIWLGELRVEWNTEAYDNTVPRIQLVDFDNNKRLDILAGVYNGKLFRIPNVGTTSAPDFKPPFDRDSMLIKTHKEGVLWCNYLAPFMTNLFGSPNILDLVMGEGTYSANSIYLLRNTGSSANPTFNEDHLTKIIPGMGLEQLTPVVVDWNNDGKPDVLSGDRTGYLWLYLNNSKDPANPTFAPGTHVTLGGQENFGSSITVTLCDLTGNHLPNLIIGQSDGTISYALNTGKLGAPVFTTPLAPLTGVLPPDYHYTAPTAWTLYQNYGIPDELISCVNPQIEKGFTFPDGEKSNYALKYSVIPAKHVYFPTQYYPNNEDFWTEHVIECNQGITLNLNKRYRVHFWVKSDGDVSSFRFFFQHHFVAGEGVGGKLRGPDISTPISAGPTWTEVSSEIEASNPDDSSVTTWDYTFQIRFQGQTSFYLDDIQIQPLN